MAGRWGVALVAFVLAGCGGLLPTAEPTPLTHSTGERDVVLRMSVVGGLPDPARTIEDSPRFTMYGDGRIIHTVYQESAAGGVTSELRLARLSEDRVDDLLEDALGPGGLAIALERYADVEVFDAVTTVFEVHAGGFDKTVSVYALGLFDESAPSAVARAAFRVLAGRLHDFGTEVDAGNATDLGTFEPQAYRVTLDRPFSELEPTADWPWDELEPADFAAIDERSLGRDVTAAQGRAVLDLGITRELVVTGPDGADYLIRIRPLLPDEVS